MFQPHRYSRTADLFDLFAECFEDADVVVLTDVYAAGEAPVGGDHGVGRWPRPPRACIQGPSRSSRPAPTWPRTWLALARAGDLVITLGAGDITKLGPKILSELAGLVG